ncbi:MAG: flagellar biosynthetic protein FliO [Planctomycetota bacterium]
MFAIALVSALLSSISPLPGQASLDAKTAPEQAAESAGSSPPVTPPAEKVNEAEKASLADFVGRRMSDSRSTPKVETAMTEGWAGAGTAISVVLVVGLVALLAFFVRRAQPSARDREGNRVLEILGRISVSPKQQVTLVRVGSRVLCVGVSPDRLSCLSEITESAEVTRLLPREFDELLAAEGGDPQELEADPTLPEGVARVEPFRNELSRLRGMVSHWRSGQSRRTSGDTDRGAV